MNSETRILVAGQRWDPSLPLPVGEWVTTAEDGSRTLLPGLVSIGGRLVVVLPRPYGQVELSPDRALTSVALFVSSLAQYARERAEGRSVTDPLVDARDDALLAVGDPGDLIDQVEAALLLWRDYAENGPLALSAPRVHDQVPGRVLWNRALRDGAPVEGRTGIVFRKMPRSSVRPDPRHELTELHEATCEEIGARFGLGAPGERRPLGAREALDRIGRGERDCFADRPRRALALLKRYYTGRDPGGIGCDVRGIFARNYEYVWERMLQVALGDEGRGSGLRGKYVLPDGHTVMGLNLRPDVVLRARVRGRGPVVLVLDAKDYAEGSLPGSSDLGKQILYRLLLSDLIDAKGPSLDDVGNAFVFPAVVPGLGVRLRATHDLVGAPLAGRPGRVVGFDVDLEQVSEAYVAGRALGGLRDVLLGSTFSALHLT